MNIACSLFLDTPQCINRFPNEATMIAKSRDITNVIKYEDGVMRYFPDLHVTCDGHVTHIIFGGRINNDVNEPNIQLWRSSVLENEITISSQYYSISTKLYQYNLSTPVPVQNGDYLGIYQPSNGHFIIYQQELNGPKNYESAVSLSDENNYPLISLVVGKYI